MLNLRHSLFLIMATVMTFLLVLANYVVTRETLNGALLLEQRLVEGHVLRVQNALQANVTAMGQLTASWAAQSESRKAIDSLAEKLLDERLIEETGLDLGLAFVAFVDSHGKVVYGRTFDRKVGGRPGLPGPLREHLLPGGPLITHPDHESRLQGLLLLGRETVLVASSPILASDDSREVRGALLLGKLLDQSGLDELGMATLLRISISPGARLLQLDLKNQSGYDAQPETGLVFDRSVPQEISGIRMLRDVFGRESVMLRVTTFRDVHQQAIATCRHIGKWFVFTGLIVILIMLLLVNLHVVVPLNRAISALHRGVDGVAATAALTARVPLCGSRELDELAEATNNMLEALEKAQREGEEHRQALIRADRLVSLGTLVSGVAHEINNPNNTILLSAEAMEEILTHGKAFLDELDTEGITVAHRSIPELCEEMQSLLTGIAASARRITRLVTELKGFSRQESPETSESVVLNEVVQGAITLIGHTVRKASRHVTVSCAEALPPVSGSFQRLEQVAVNLLQNAAQALTDSSQEIEIGTGAGEDGTVLLWVRDGGRGIRPEDLPHIRDPFFTTRREEGGTGLGLAISATIVMEHRGTIDVESLPGQGTRVVVKLPSEPEPS